jgi:hypothetical protein
MVVYSSTTDTERLKVLFLERIQHGRASDRGGGLLLLLVLLLLLMVMLLKVMLWVPQGQGVAMTMMIVTFAVAGSVPTGSRNSRCGRIVVGQRLVLVLVLRSMMIVDRMAATQLTAPLLFVLELQLFLLQTSQLHTVATLRNNQLSALFGHVLLLLLLLSIIVDMGTG